MMSSVGNRIDALRTNPIYDAQARPNLALQVLAPLVPVEVDRETLAPVVPFRLPPAQCGRVIIDLRGFLPS
jgi:hypothetical protein